MAEAPIDIVLPILKNIQSELSEIRMKQSDITSELQGVKSELSEIRMNTEQIPEMARDIQELVSKVGAALELEQRVRRIEQHLHLD